MTVRDRLGRVRLIAGVLAVALVLVVACTRSPESAPPPEPGAGAGPGSPPTLEDPYFPGSGNGGYQVDRYDLRLTYDPASKQLTGSADVTGTATERLPVFGLDLAGLTVDTVTVDGAEAGFDRRDDKLVITPAEPVPADAGFEVTVDYHGVPEPVTHPQLGTNGFHHTGDGGFAIGQPRSASTWFPVNDHPSDKAAYTFDITVPEGLAAISNGVPTGRSSAEGWTTWSWSEPMPMASYLTTLAIGDYRVHETEHRRRPMVVAVHADLPTDVDDQLARSGEVADQLEEWFGPYPFSSYGGIVLADERISFALETQSRPIYGPGFFTRGRDGTWVIVHEQAHQWFGNSVSLSRWSDIWLNEGFATYAEWLWEETDGGDTVAEAFDLQYDGPGAEPEFWQVPPGDPGAERMFHSAVYNRGAMVIHALRVEVGDEAFFSILRAWVDTYRHGNATADDFIALCERISGASLTSLFDDWLFGTQRPEHPGEPRP